MNTHLTKEYFKYLFYKAFSLGFMVVSLSFFLFESNIGNLFFNSLLFVFAVVFTAKATNLKPPLSECLSKCDPWIELTITIGNTVSFMGSVLFVVYMLSGREMEMINLLYLLLIGLVFGTAYFLQCKKSML
jgi:hypothetical protein